MKKLTVVIWMMVMASLLPMSSAIAKPASAKKTPAKKIVTKTTRAADEKAIKQAAFKFCHASTSGFVDQGKPREAKVKFAPIGFVGNWATTQFIFYPVVDPNAAWSPDSTILLKKSGGHWRVVARYYGGSMKPAKAKSIGLTATIAKKLDIAITPTAD
jgi:hypothetical protein